MQYFALHDRVLVRNILKKIQIYLLLEYSDNYSIVTIYNFIQWQSVNFWNYYRDEICDADASEGKSFKHRTKITGKNEQDEIERDDDRPSQPPVQYHLCCLSNFWRSIDFTLIICDIELHLPWSKNCILSKYDDNLTV